MPELPEVETIARNLQAVLIGKTITAAQVLWGRSLASPSPDEFVAKVTGQTVRGTGRRGKYLIIHLTQDTLLIHLRMSGDLLWRQAGTPPATHDRIHLTFSDGSVLAFYDPRKFGRLWLTDRPDQVLARLGPEPLDENFTLSDFYARLQQHHRQLKPLLLDQSFLAGIGNIYADESLHLAQLHPQTPANSLASSQAERLLQSLRAMLEKGIRHGGATIDWVYRGGHFQHHFRVYQRKGLPCPECHTIIQRIVVGQRGTYLCPVCQPISDSQPDSAGSANPAIVAGPDLPTQTSSQAGPATN